MKFSLSFSTRTRQSGQATILAVMGFTMAALTMAYMSLSRSTGYRKAVLASDNRARAIEALEASANKLYRLYVTEANCDPGMLALNPGMLTPGSETFFLGTNDASLSIRGNIVGFPKPNISAAAYRMGQANMEFYAVRYLGIKTVERTTVPLTNMQDIIFPDSTGADPMVVRRLDEVTEPKTGGAVFNTQTAGAMGPRDMSIEMAVSYPPLAPKFIIHQTVVFLNSCTTPVRGASTGTSSNLSPIDVSNQPASVANIICANLNTVAHVLGSPSVTFDKYVIDGTTIEFFRHYIKEGLINSSTFDTIATTMNCLDINRDGLVNDSDLGILEKYMSGYLLFIPPISPEFKGGKDSPSTDPAHQLN